MKKNLLLWIIGGIVLYQWIKKKQTVSAITYTTYTNLPSTDQTISSELPKDALIWGRYYSEELLNNMLKECVRRGYTIYVYSLYKRGSWWKADPIATVYWSPSQLRKVWVERYIYVK